MCALCGVLSNEHWADEGAGRRARMFRTALLEPRPRRTVRPRRTGVGGAYVRLRRQGRHGARRRSRRRSGSAAERLAGRPLDPLDPALLEALAS